jgi:hypothetical protein
MNLQKINVKLFLDASGPIDLDPFLAIFARWREQADHPAGWIDLADYAHVERGPGILLIGKQGNLSADLADPGPGILYANKQDLDGDPEERIRTSFRRGVGLIERLLEEPQFPRNLTPRTDFWGLTFNDRLEVPHGDETDRRLRPAVRAVADRLFGPGAYQIVSDPEKTRRYGVTLHSADAPALSALAGTLQASAR